MLTIKLINKAGEFEELRDEWTDVLRESAVDTIYLTNEWLHSWWQVYAGDSELFILTVRDDESLIGIAPLIIRRYSLLPYLKFPVRQIEFLGVGEGCSSNRMDFIIKKGMQEDFFNAVFDFIIENKQRWDTVKLTDINEDSDSIPYLEKFSKERGFIYKNDDLAECPFIILPKTIEEYQNSIHKKSQETIRRKRRKLEREFDLKFERVCSPDSLDNSVDELARINKKRWTQRGMKSCFSSQKMIRFHKKISKIFLEKNWLDFCFMNLNGINVACSYCFRYNRKVYLYQTAFDPTFIHSKYSIGSVTTDYSINHAIERGCEKFHLGRGVNGYKMRYANDVKKTVSVRIGRKNFRGILLTSILNGGSSMKNFMVWILPDRTINKIKGRVIDTDLSIFR